MAYSHPEIKKFAGLYAQPNTFDLPEGAMDVANNVMLRDDNTIQKIRGFYEYNCPVSGTLNALFYYQDKLMAVFTDKIGYFTDAVSPVAPNEVGTFTALTGQAFTITAPLQSRYVEQNGNLYWTTDQGVMKIDAYNGKIFGAGTPGGLDCRGSLLAQNGPFSGFAEVGYRVCFGRRDANDNLILGAPSDVLTLTNLKVLQVSWARVAAVATITTPTAHNLVTGMLVTISGSTGAVPIAAGVYLVTVTGSTTYTIASVGADSSGLVDYTSSRTVLLEASIPDDITAVADGYFAQVYRTSQSNSDLAVPSQDYRLVEEVTLSASDLNNRVFFYQDDTDDLLITNAPELYTNTNSREGELQANARPPYASDITLFQNYIFYGNCRTRAIVQLDVINAGNLVNNDYIEIKQGATTRRYVGRTGVGNQSVKVDGITNAAGNLQIDYTGHNFLNGYTIYISQIVGGSLAQGTYFIVAKTANNFQLSLTSGGASIAYSAVTSAYFQGVTNGADPIFLISTAASAGTSLRETAQGIVKAVNRDLAAPVYANYTSQVDDTPGKMRISAEGFAGTISVLANTALVGQCFAPILPTSFASGTQVSSKKTEQINAVYFSKVGEPEAVPILNYLLAGSKNKELSRINALRDSVIILKKDGVFKLTGYVSASFAITSLDNTIIVLAPNSGAVLNNKVFFLGTQGICSATDSAVEIISRRIEDLITPILGNAALVAQTAALSYESDRTYRISTLALGASTKTVTYIFNNMNNTWTQSDILFTAGVVGPSNKLYIVSDNCVLKERKYGNRLDYVMQNYTATIVSVLAPQNVSGCDRKSPVVYKVTCTISGYVPKEGDVIVKNDVINRIRAVSIVGPTITLTFDRQTNLVAADSVPLYQGIISNVTMSPFHGGTLGVGKQFSQLQLHTRTANLSRLKITFQGQSFGGSGEIDWIDTVVTGGVGGWGFSPWGFFPWGLTDSIEAKVLTEPAPVIRVYVPLFQQRNTFIQTVMKHQEAGESIDIQAMSWSLRKYEERVSK